MNRKSFAAVAVLVVGAWAGQARAGEVVGKVKSVDAEKGTVTVEVDSAEKVYLVSSDARVVGTIGKKVKKATTETVPGGLRGVKEGVDVTLSTEARDGKDVVVGIKVGGLQPKAKAKGDKKKQKTT